MVKNNNGWLWTAIIMIVLNVILLGYIFLGSGGVSLSPTGCDGTIVNVFGLQICTVGNGAGLTELQLGKSKVSNADTKSLRILSNELNGIRIAGIDNNNQEKPTTVNVNGDLTAVGKISFTKGQNIGTFYTTTNFMGICFANAGSGTYSSCGITLSPGGGIDPTWRCQFGCSQT